MPVMPPRPDSLGSGAVWWTPETRIIHFGSPVDELIPFAAAQAEKETRDA